MLNEVKQVGSRYYGTFDYFTSKSKISSSDSGLFAADDYNNTKSYFYRGMVDNNYVRFACNYYKIIRINGDGSIRLIYVGPTTSTTQGIANASFNSTDGRIYSLFYMYVGIKTRASYNTRASLQSYFFDNYNNETDQNRGVEGNGALSYKVGLITLNDIYYAGSFGGAGQSNNYLFYGNWTRSWTMSPFQYKYDSFTTRTIYILTYSNVVGTSPNGSYIIRPVINLDKDTYITGGSGTSSCPYEVISKQEYDSIHNN